jgi:hypothetical protein
MRRGNQDRNPADTAGVCSTISEARQSSASLRFVGDLNPEAVFLGHALGADKDRVGVWTRVHAQETSISSSVPNEGTRPTIHAANDQSPSKDSTGVHAKGQSYEKFLSAMGFMEFPSEEDEEALIEIYFQSINHVLPILDAASFYQSYKDDSVSKILVHAVCLVACKHSKAILHLRLSADSEPVLPREFAKAIYRGLMAAVAAKLEKDRITLIRILALLSLHSEGPQGDEDASLNLTQAIHHSQTIGLHLGRSHDGPLQDSHQRLFWCLWSLDRVHACINGRPNIINKADIGLRIHDWKPSGDARAFKIWLQIAQILDDVMNLYRPLANDYASRIQDLQCPLFERIVERNHGTELDPSILSQYCHLSGIRENQF